MHGIVHEQESNAFFGERVHLCPALPHDAGGIRVDDHGPGGVQDGLIRRPALDHAGPDIETALFVQGLGEDLASGIELVFARAMAAATGEEDDVGGGGKRTGREKRRHGEGTEGRDHA